LQLLSIRDFLCVPWSLSALVANILLATKALRLQVSLSHDISSSVNSAMWNMRILGAEGHRYGPRYNQPGLSLKVMNLWVHGSYRQAGSQRI